MTVSVFPPTAGGGGGGGTDTGWTVVDSFSVTQDGKAAVDLAASTYWVQVQSTPSTTGSLSLPLAGGDFKTVASFAFDSAGQAGAYVTFDTAVTELLTIGISGYITIASFTADVSPISFSATQISAYGQPMQEGKNTRYPDPGTGIDTFQENATHIMLQRGNIGQNWQMIMNKATGAWSYPTYYWNNSQVVAKEWQYGSTGLGRNVILQPNGSSNSTNFDRFTWDEAKNTYWRENAGVDVNKTISGQSSGYWFFAYDDNVGTNGRFYNLSSNGNRIYYSDDNGDSWTAGGTVTTSLFDISVAEDGTVFAKTTSATQTIYYSTDNGVTFNPFVAPLSAVWFRPVWNATGGFWTLSHTTQTGSVYTATTIGNTWTPRTFTSSYQNAHPRVVAGKTVVFFRHYTSQNKAVSAITEDTWTVSPYVNYQNYISNYNNTSYGPTATYIHNGLVKAWVNYQDLPPLLFDPADNRVHYAGAYLQSTSGQSNVAQSPDGQYVSIMGSSNVSWMTADYGERWHARALGNYSYPVWFKGGFLYALSGSSTGYRYTPIANYQWSLSGWSKPSLYHNYAATNGEIVVWGSNGTNYYGWTTGGTLGTEIITNSIGGYSNPCFGTNGDGYLMWGTGSGLYAMDTKTGMPTGGEILGDSNGTTSYSGVVHRLNWNGNVYGYQFNNGQLIMRKLTPTAWSANSTFGDLVSTDMNAGITTTKAGWIVIDSQRNSAPWQIKRWLIEPSGAVTQIVAPTGYPSAIDDASAKYYGAPKLGNPGYTATASIPTPDYCIGLVYSTDYSNDTYYQPEQQTFIKILYEES